MKAKPIRTSIDLPRDLHRRLHEAAARKGCSARQLILAGIRGGWMLSMLLQEKKARKIADTVASQIEIDDHGVAWIAGANTKVLEVVLDKKPYGWSGDPFSAPALVPFPDSLRARLLL